MPDLQQAAPGPARTADRCELDHLCDALTSIVIQIDAEGLVRRWNRAAERILRTDRDAAIGRPLAELPLPLTTGHLARALAEGSWRRRLLRIDSLAYLDTDGTPRALALTFHPVRDDAGNCMGAMILGRDVTDRLREESRELQRRKLESLATLSGGLAHELNNPVQFIASNLEFVCQAVAEIEDAARRVVPSTAGCRADRPRDAASDSTVRRVSDLVSDGLFDDLRSALDAIRNGWERIASIVSSMRDFAGVDHAGSLVDLNRLVRSAATVVGAERGVEGALALSLEDDLPLLPGDSRGLSQALYHLLTNAVEAALKAHRESPLARVTTSADGTHITLVVEDSGCGLSEGEAARAFDPFYTTKEVGRGCGQGLAVVHGIVSVHGGSIDVERSELGGARFLIRLPLQTGPLPEDGS